MTDDLSNTTNIYHLLKSWEEHNLDPTASELASIAALDESVRNLAFQTLLAHPERIVVFAAIEAIERIGPTSTTAKLLVSCLNDPRSDVRWTTRDILYHTYDTQVVLPLTHTLLEDTDPDVRLMAAEALSKVGDSRALPALTYTVTNDHAVDFEERSIAEAAHRAISAIQEREKTVY